MSNAEWPRVLLLPFSAGGQQHRATSLMVSILREGTS